jgi:hypothetical protein
MQRHTMWQCSPDTFHVAERAWNSEACAETKGRANLGARRPCPSSGVHPPEILGSMWPSLLPAGGGQSAYLPFLAELLELICRQVQGNQTYPGLPWQGSCRPCQNTDWVRSSHFKCEGLCWACSWFHHGQLLKIQGYLKTLPFMKLKFAF